MSIEFKLPDLGENIEAGDVINVLVSVGDSVTADQAILEMETGKATIEVPSTVAGVIRKIHVQAGDKVRVGQIVLTLDGEGAKQGDGEVVDSAPSTLPPKPAAEPQAPAPKPQPASEEKEKEKEKEDASAAPPAPAPVQRAEHLPVPAAPSVRKFAREVGLDVRQVPGSGPGGRITIQDVKAFTKKIVQSGGGTAAPAGAGGPIPAPLPDFSTWGEIDVQPMSSVRKLTAEHMARCWSNIPHVTQHDQADITILEEYRKRWKSKVEQAGGKLTPTAMLLKIVAGAIKAHPQFASSIDPAKQTIIQKKYMHIGVAVDTPKGLVVPVIRNVDRKNIIELSVELTDIAKRARDGKVGLSEMQGGVFTITNLGGIGGTYFTPIVNHPDVAILGVGRGSLQPVYVDGRFEPRLLMPLSLSYDHRVIDGADGARFLQWIVQAISEPILLALEG